MNDPEVMTRLLNIRQHVSGDKRAPHKPLLILLALGRLQLSGSSAIEWSVAEKALGQLLREFGTSNSVSAVSVAQPFTRLRADGVWTLSQEVPNDSVTSLRASPIEGRFAADIESELQSSSDKLHAAARAMVDRHFPATLAPDVLVAVGLDPNVVLGQGGPAANAAPARRRDPSWRRLVVEAWDRSCAFCGFDGALGGAPVGIEAAHVRWFNFEGPDDLENGLALCSLHHKLLDRGVLGLRDPETITVSSTYSAMSEQGRRVYELHEKSLRPRPGTKLPAVEHVAWHTREVFKGAPIG